MRIFYFSALLGGAMTLAYAFSADAQDKAANPQEPSQTEQMKALSTLDMSDLQKMSDQDAEAAANNFMEQFRASKMLESQAGYSLDSETGTTEFPGDLFHKVDSFRSESAFLKKRLKSGKRSRAIYQMDSQYRENLSVIGKMSSQAAHALKDSDPETAKRYADISRQIMMSVMTPSDPKDIKSQSKWLSEVDGAIDKIAVLRKKPAR